MFKFTITHHCSGSKARTAVFSTPHGTLSTPIFMPVGTKGAVKTLLSGDLMKLGAEIILANTYHLTLRPGADLIKNMGGLHQWINFQKPILTDSGGFQIFSLKKLRIVSDQGVEFQSPLDGTKHFFTPEKAIELQIKLGADIMMCFDECCEADVAKLYAKEAMDRTHRWTERAIAVHQKTRTQQALFPIIQGGIYHDLRIESAKWISNLNLPGIAIGGLSVGEGKKTMYEIIDLIEPLIPKTKPRYLMGVGTPEDLLECIEMGMDMFDCVLPTRLARHGTFYGDHQLSHLKNRKYKEDQSPLRKDCACQICEHYSRSYLRHLYFENEISAHRALTIHNLHFLLDLMRKIRAAIALGQFTQFKTQFLANWKSMKT